MNYITQLINAIQSQYPSLTEVQAIGRQNDQGIIVIDNHEYGGISDKKGNYAYIRYRGRDDWRHARATRQLSSIKTMVATSEMRLVVVHDLVDVADFVSGLVEVMTGVFNCVATASLEVVSTDQDRNRILREESKGEHGSWNNAVGLVRIDFNFSYTYVGKACDPSDLCGGGTSPVPPPVDCPTLCDLIETATAQQVVDCFDEFKEEAVKELICDPCPPCEDAIYSNGGDYIQAIPCGDSFIAPQIVVTDVNGTTRNVLPNIAVTCAWSTISVRSTDSTVLIGTIPTYPSGGVALMGTQRVKQQDDTTINTVPWRANIKIMNADIDSVVTAADETQITILKETCPTLGELIEDATWSEIEDDLSPAQLAAAEASICTPCPPPPTAIAPMFIPATQKTVYFTGKLDEGGRIAAGDFDLPAGAFAEQQGSDYATATPFLNLLHNNEFGNKSAFCDTAGNPLDYSSSTPADNIVLHTGYRRMWYIVRTAATSVDNALDLAAAASHGGFTDWRIPTRAEIHSLFDYDNTNAMNTVSGKPPGFNTLSMVGITSCTTNSLSTTAVFITFSNGARQTTPVAASTAKNFILVRTY